MVCLNSSSSGSMEKIPRNRPALSSFGFSIAHFCFSFRFDASDICFHISGHDLSGLEVVCVLVSLSPDHVYPSVLLILFLHPRSSDHRNVSPTIHPVTYVLFR